MEEIIIHIDWNGPFKWNDANDNKQLLNNDSYGLYQIYGRHPIYGNESLLYIGKSQDRTIGSRVKEHETWLTDSDNGKIIIYIGLLYNKDYRIFGQGSFEINAAESLLIYVHTPPYNKLGKIDINRDLVRKGYHLLNWYEHRDLLPEVSVARWANLFPDD